MNPNTKFINKDSLQLIDKLTDDYSDYESSDIDFEIKEPKIKYKEVIHSIIINSADRDWVNSDDTPYNFRVKFNPESEKREKKPLYENNPTIPATIAQSNNGLRGNNNTSGWYDSSNTFRLAYDPSQPLGNIVDIEYITIKENNYAPINVTFKNIRSIKMIGAVLPNHKKRIEYTTSYDYLSDYQYINVHINELENTQEGTNTNLRKSFAVLYPKTKISTSTPNYIDYVNINKWESFINLNTLPLMTIQCFEPSTKQISNLNDVLNIRRLYQYQTNLSDSRTEYIGIETNDYFDPNEFVSGHKIVIKNYQYRDTDNPYANSFNQFINREEGHYIVDTAGYVGSTKYLKNIIYIPKPAVLNTVTGDVDDVAWFTLFKLNDFTNDPDSILDDEPGKILNLNMQTSFFFHIRTMEPDSSVMNLNQII
jgi:hypothetical protein